jgi:hypothetical protein
MSSTISTKTNFNKGNIRILSVDFETRQITTKKYNNNNNNNKNTRNQIFAAGFYTNTVISMKSIWFIRRTSE